MTHPEAADCAAAEPETDVRPRPVVAVVEDDPDYQQVLKAWLSGRYEVIRLRDGEELKDQLDIRQPDLLILDVNLPGQDGFRLCDRLRADARFSRLPIIFLTGMRRREDFLKHLEVGGSAFLSKPIERVALLTEVARFLGET